MFNRCRTLLLNESADPAFPYAEEAVPDEFFPKRLFGPTSIAYRAVFGEADRAGKNWLLAALAHTLHCRVVDPFARRADDRVSYHPGNRQAPIPPWQRFGRVTVAGPDDLGVFGSPTYTGRLVRTFRVTANPLGEVSIREGTDPPAEQTVTFDGGLSSQFRLVPDVRLSVPSTGGEWVVTTVGAPRIHPASILEQLLSTGVIQARMRQDAELRTAYEATGQVPERLGFCLVALADLIDLA